MNPKIIAGLVFALIAALLGLIAYGPPEIGDVRIRKLLILLVVLTVFLFQRFRRRQTQSPVEGKASERYNSSLKPLFLTLAVTFAAAYFLVPNASWPACSLIIALCLQVVFLGRERIEDERVEHLKLKAIKSAFTGAFILVFLYSWLIDSLRREGWKDHLLSAYDLIIVTMLIALALFRYWRWQDGREKTG